MTDLYQRDGLNDPNPEDFGTAKHATNPEDNHQPTTANPPHNVDILYERDGVPSPTVADFRGQH